MKKLASIFALLLISGTARGQSARPTLIKAPRPEATTANTGVLWSWTAPSGAASDLLPLAYNLYQSAGGCPASGVPSGTIIAQGTTLTTFVQTPIPAGLTCTWVTAVSVVGVEGPPSPAFQLDTTAPGAPGRPSPTLQ